MIENRRNKDRHIRFYCLLIFLCGLCFVRYALQINFPSDILLIVVALIAVLGDRDEIIAMMMCCIPLHTSLNFFYALLVCLAVFLLKFYREIYINISLIPLLLMVIWELLHCFGKPFSLITFAANFLPLVVLTVLMFYKGKTIDYPFICRALSFCIMCMCILLLGRILFVARFNVARAVASIWRLGADTVEAKQTLKIEGGHQNPNTLGILCVLGTSGLLQLRRMGVGNKKDIILIIFLVVFGALTSSRTYLACLMIMAVLFLFSQKGGVNQKFKLLIQLLLFVAIALLLLYLLFPNVLEYYFSRLVNRDKYLSRGDLMAIYHKFIVENERILFFGIGLQNYFTELTNAYRVSISVPHNAIQEMIIAWGIPSIALFIMLGISMMLQSRRFCKNQGLINYIPILIILAKSMVGQLLDSPYTLLALSYGYLSMRQEITPATQKICNDTFILQSPQTSEARDDLLNNKIIRRMHSTMNYSKFTRFLSMLLAVVMVIGYVPVSTFAAEGEENAAPVTATVEFDVNGGVGEYEDQVVNVGETVTKPEQDPTYEGYEFAHWTADLETNIAWNFEEDAVTEDLTLYAAWTAAAMALAEGDDTTVEGAGDDTTAEGEGDDTTAEGEGDDTTAEGEGDDTTVEGEGDDTIVEGEGDDTTVEGEDDDTTVEGEGDDTTVEGEGDDTTVEGEGETQTVPFTVNYYKWDWDQEENVLIETEELSGIPGTQTEVQAKEYEGLILMEEIAQAEILADGSTVVNVYYTEQLEDPALLDTGVIYEDGKFGYNGYYNVISRKDYTLVPGAAYEYEMVLNNADGNRRQVIHVIEVDPSNPDVSIVPGYNQIDKLAEDPNNEANWAHKELTEMAKYYENNLGYNIVGGMNTDLYYDTYAPRILVYNGQDLSVKGKTSPSSSILYVFKDAEGKISCDVRAFNRAEFDSYLADGTLLHAVGVSFAMVVKDGELVSKTEERTSAPAARSMVGVKEDGTLVICMNDGRGANNSVGFCNFEEGEAMLALGCKWAANCDGGGSSTFLTKRAGEETFTMRSVPCDGSQRPTAHGIFVASNVGATGELNNVNIVSEYDIFAPSTVYTFGAEAIDTHGYAMDMPADAAWALSDETFGTIDNGVFTSNGTKGTVDVQVISNGAVVGSKTITVADPEVFKLSADSTVVPYSTAEKVRTITLPIVAMTGEANVYYDTNVVTVALSDENAGMLDGFNFTATSDTSVAGVNVTVTYGETVLTYAISYGKGSEIIYDFEDGDKAGFMGFEEAKAWSKTNDINNTLVGSNPLDGQFNEYLSSQTSVVTAAEGGQVRNGNYALEWKLDNTDAAFASWSYNVLFNTGDTIVLRDKANDKLATTLGMWIYIPENAFSSASGGNYSLGKGLAFQSQFYVKNADGSYACKQDHFMFTSAATGKQTNLNSATNADIPESRWVYATIDISKYDYLCTPVATDAGNSRSPSFIRTYVKPDTADVVTFYIDDITLDYSSAVDDRVLPTITNPTYSTSDTAVTLDNGAEISGTKFAFAANVADNAALDLTSGKILVDGVAVQTAIAGSVLSTKEDVNLNAGVHTVSFEVKDELGNPAKLTRTFTVAGDAAVTLTGHNDSGEAAKAQSVYYVDINVADIAKVGTLTAQLHLNNANTWETKGAVIANGFNATFSYNNVSELLTVTVTAENASLAEGNTLVSIPVRVWTWDRFNFVTEQYVAVTGNMPVVNVECDVVYGTVDGAPFGGSINVATELTTISSPYHKHDAELTVQNQDASCSVDGYNGRTYCESCKSVVAWGEIIEATGHNYVLTDGKFTCQNEGCGNVLATGTGVVEVNGDLYYSVNGELKIGWQDMGTYEGDDYINGGSPYTMYGYAGSDYKMYVNGEYTINGITYTFAEDGTTMGAWTTNGTGTRYSVGPAFIKRSWVTLAGSQYYFGEDTYVYTGTRSIPKNRNNLDEGVFWYLFSEDGKFVKEYTDYTGFLTENGTKYYIENGRNTYGGLMLIDGYYYYARSTGEVICNKTYWPTKTNDLLPAANYEFDADGKMLNPPMTEPEQPDVPEVKNGIVSEDGKLWWYVDDVKTYGGLMLIDGDYYYARSTGEIICGKTYWPTKTNDLLPAANYEFGADGKMLNPPVAPDPDPEPDVPVVPETKNGIVSEDGKLWWYVDDVKTYGGLMLIDGAYYYARSTGEIICGKTYWPTKTNDLLPAANYVFGVDGKMLNPPVTPDPDPEPDVPVVPETKNGIVSEGGKLWWYVDDVKTYGGLMLIDGDYYYARTSGEILTSCDYWISKTNDLLPATKYTFGADGKMVDPPVA